MVIAALDWTGIAAAISAVAALVTAAGAIVIAVITKGHGSVLRQVEKQGNSQSLEFKRLVMVFSRRTAIATAGTVDGVADKAIADDAQKVYEEAKAAAERDSKTK